MPPIFSYYVALLLLALTAGATRAEEADGLKLVARADVRHDNNLFRLAPTANALSLIGKPSPAETTHITTWALRYSKAYSLQNVDLDLSMVDYRYQNFDYLNFTAVNYRAVLQWSYTPDFHGSVLTSREQTLNSFSDFRNFNQRNKRVDLANRVDATYELDARWRLLGAFSKYESSNQRPLIVETSSSQKVVDAGLRYVLPSQSYAGFTLRSSDGAYTDPAASGINAANNGFTQSESQVDLFLVISAKTSADLILVHKSRKHSGLPQRDFSGTSGAAKLSWTISAKSALIAAWTRDLDAYQTSNSNFYTADRFSLGPVWRIGSKTTAGLTLGTSIRTFGGSPGAIEESHRRDISRDAGLSISWQPQSYLAFGASVLNARRLSNTPGLNFNSNLISLSAQFTF